MGLFSRHKKEESKSEMPPKNVGQSSSGKSEMTGESFGVNLNEPPKTGMEEGSKLSAPSAPTGGSTFDDIKSQVASPRSSPSAQPQAQNVSQENDSFDLGDDSSLFDMSDLDFSSNDSNSQQQAPSMDVASEVPDFGDLSDSTVDTNEHSQSDLSFISSKPEGPGSKGTYFVTTSQFKTLLEIVDSVKGKVKEASETHLRLMDIKSEEDIEYENLRKDFQFIEDKLYELDSIIFDK